jgi:hypothetical protein
MGKRTPLYDIHKKLGAKMVEFGGWDMPVSYSGVLKEHEAVRTKMGLFDVSHMEDPGGWPEALISNGSPRTTWQRSSTVRPNTTSSCALRGGMTSSSID